MIHSLGQIIVSAHFQIFMTGDCHYGDIWDSFYERFYGLLTEIASHTAALIRSYRHCYETGFYFKKSIVINGVIMFSSYGYDGGGKW